MDIPAISVVELSRERIDLGRLVERLKSDDCGAVCVFSGITRADEVDGRRVKALQYEAYETMAVQELEDLCAEARSRQVF